MTKIDWREFILKIKKQRGWKIKTIAYKMSINQDTLLRWQRGATEPRHSQGERLLELAETGE
jgi:ribosome-binding protein aMBF1 (putative translation factor)